MAFTLNKIQIIGNLGKDAEHSVTPSGASVSRFSIPTENNYKDKDGNWKKETTWHNITAFNLTDYAKNVLHKGAKVYVEGRLTIDKYEAKDGTKRESAKIIAQQIISLSNNQTASTEQAQDIPEQAPIEDDLPF